MTPPVLAHPNLRRLAGSRRSPVLLERCHLCASPIAGDHRHLLEIDTGRLLCGCRACWLPWLDRDVEGDRLRAVPERVISIGQAGFTAEQWDVLQIPVALAFFRFSSATGQATAFYPSPAGAIESQLPIGAWADLVDANTWLRTLTPDVEAVLVRGAPDGRACYIVPILDACYELVGRIRKQWAGFGGGDAVRDEIDRFFAALQAKSRDAHARGSNG